MNKVDVRQRLVIPANLVEFLDKLQAAQGLKTRRDVVLAILRDAKRRHRHAVAQARSRIRRKAPGSNGHTVA